MVGDGSGRMKLVFFNHRHAQLKPNAWGMFAGTVGEWRGEKQFAHPDMHLLEGTDDEATGPARSCRSTRRARTSPAG